MSDHNFEKQIQQKLDELKIPPADTVWSAVYERIRKDKRRRRGLILFPIIFLLLSTATYFIIRTDGANKTTTVKLSPSESNSPNNRSTPDNSKVSETDKQRNKDVADQSKTSQTDQQYSNRRGSTPAESKENTTSDTKDPNNKMSSKKARKKYYMVDVNGSGVTKANQAEKSLPKKIAGNNKREADHVSDQAVVSQSNISKNQRPIVVDDEKGTELQPVHGPTDPLKDSLTNDQPAASDLSKNQAFDSMKLQAVDTVLTDLSGSAKKQSEKRSTTKKWRWGLDASVGISNVNEGGFFSGKGFLPGILTEEKLFVADASSRSPNAPPITNAPAPIVYKPSAIEKGFSFIIGASIQKNISRRFSVSTGLNYHSYANSIRVGNRVDSMATLQNASGFLNVGLYYRSAPLTTTYRYTNRYHFIDLPLALHAQLNRSRRMSVLWSGGLSISYLVSTNALHFDSHTGVYYKDNSLFNKLQANVSTGFSISVFNNSAVPIHIGPQVKYGLTNLLKKEVSEDRHLLYFGLNTRFFLRK